MFLRFFLRPSEQYLPNPGFGVVSQTKGRLYYHFRNQGEERKKGQENRKEYSDKATLNNLSVELL